VGRKPERNRAKKLFTPKRGLPTATNRKTKQAGFRLPGWARAPVNSHRDDHAALADWMSNKDTPFSLPKRWSSVTGNISQSRLVDPEDDIREPTHPPFRSYSGAGRKFIDSPFRNLKKPRANHLPFASLSAQLPANKFNAVDKQYFSRLLSQRLTAEVLLDRRR